MAPRVSLFPWLGGLRASWLVLLSVLLNLPLSAAPQPPNLVVILVDDLGWSDLGCYGNQFYLTPNLDRMAREGMRFTQAYAAAPVCSPTRASLMTGQHPARLHLTDWLPGRADRPDQKLKRPAIQTNLSSSALTLAEALKSAGYATAHIGKWHLGGPDSRPEDHGFDVNIAGDHTGTPLSYWAPFARGPATMPGLDNSAPGEYLTDRLTAEAEKFIAAHRDQPFFLYLAHYAVHIPLTAKRGLIEKYEKRQRPGALHTNAVYAAMVESMDASVGRILRKLDALGLAGRTMVLFTSDNGGLAVREGPATPSTSNAPLRAGKGYLYEGGLRVPLLAWGPGLVLAGKEATTPVSSVDFYPTLLELAGAKPALRQDGRSFVPVLKHTGDLDRDSLCWHYPHYSNQGGRPGGAIRAGDLKLIEFYESGYLELYNLCEDPSETNNLAGALPRQANDLARKLADWRKALGVQMMTPNPAYVPVPIGQAADGSITLPAQEVILHGSTVRYEPPAHKNTIGYWTKAEDWVSWPLAVSKPGTFAVEILQGCGNGSGGSSVELSVGDQRLKFTVQETGGFQTFVWRDLGRITLVNPGPYTLAVKPLSKPALAVMDLREVRLRPVAH